MRTQSGHLRPPPAMASLASFPPQAFFAKPSMVKAVQEAFLDDVDPHSLADFFEEAFSAEIHTEAVFDGLQRKSEPSFQDTVKCTSYTLDPPPSAACRFVDHHACISYSLAE